MSATAAKPWFFDSEENFRKHQEGLRKWEGTPFRAHACYPGTGADCVHWVAQHLYEIGAIQKVSFPAYVTRGGGPMMLEIFLGVMDSIRGLKRVWRLGDEHAPAFERGDVVLFSTGKHLHHLGILENPPVIWHMMNSVTQGSVADPVLSKRIWAVYRVSHAD